MLTTKINMAEPWVGNFLARNRDNYARKKIGPEFGKAQIP